VISTTRDLSTGKLIRCNFCGKAQYLVKKLVAGPNVYICDKCVKQAQKTIKEKPNKCSFCDKRDKQIHQVFAGLKNIHICDDCVKLAQDLIEEK
jgi:ATP-dependent protease Clp ATPase subunit